METDRAPRSFSGLLALLTGLCAAVLSVAWRERVGQIGFALGAASVVGYALALRSALATF